ncbi:MAG: alpha/beta hydrolase-fold protein [Planctomycetales bacterium]
MHVSRALRRQIPFTVFLPLLLLLFAAPLLAQEKTPAAWQFNVELGAGTLQKPFTGRLYLLCGSANQVPRKTFDWFNLPPMIAVDVENMLPGKTYSIASSMPTVKTYPPQLTNDLLQHRSIQAIFRLNPFEPDPFEGEGNAVCMPQVVQLQPEGSFGTPQTLVADRIVPPSKPPEDPQVKIFSHKSELLSRFFQRDFLLKAAVHLPRSYAHSPDRKYPVVYDTEGFGADHLSESPIGTLIDQRTEPTEFIRVMLNPKCPLGHSTFADSANNGPFATALVTEFIPALEREFRMVAAPHARFLTGHSSGGWSSLWLQVSFPQFFGGVWSYSPDPVDFRDFQQINLYAPDANMFFDARGDRRPIARENGIPVLWYQDFSRMEEVYGHGSQLHSFEAVFSPRLPTGMPAPLWDRKTGRVDHAVAEAWKKYDIHLKLVDNWPTLKPHLAGKLHIFVGENDSFYLEGAVKLLKTSLQELGSDAVVEIFPGLDHDSILSQDLMERNFKQMAQTFLRAGTPQPAVKN